MVHEEFGFMRTREIPEIDTSNPEAVKELYRTVEIACRPCPKEETAKELYAMSLGMARRKDQDLDFKMMLAGYANDLTDSRGM